MSIKTKHPRDAPPASRGLLGAQGPHGLRAPHPWVDAWLEHQLVVKGLSENSLAAYSQDLRLFQDFLEERSHRVEDVSSQTIFLYQMFVRQKGLTSRSLARHLSSLRGFFAHAVAEGWLTASPTELIEAP